MTKKEAMQQLTSANPTQSYHAAEYLQTRITKSDLPRLIEAFRARPDYVVRIDIIDMVATVATEEARVFLSEVAKSRDYFLVRYYAMRHLIEMGDRGWLPNSRRKQRSDFYASLIAYMSYRDGLLSLQELHQLAKLKTRHPLDHWAWLTGLD